jgi:hypothetical protein
MIGQFDNPISFKATGSRTSFRVPFRTDHRATLVQFESSGPKIEARKRKRRFFSNRRRNRPLSHHALQGKNLADMSGPTRHWCSGQTINDALHVCVESKMRFLIDNHNPKNQQKSTLTLYRLIHQKIHYVWKCAHLVSTMEQVLIQIVTQ